MKKFTFLILIVVSCSSVFANRINYKLAVENKMLKQQVLKLTLALKQANCAPSVTNIKTKHKVALLEKKNAQLQKLYETALCEKQELAKSVQELQACVTDYETKYQDACEQIVALNSSYTEACNKRNNWKKKYDDACGQVNQLKSSYAKACEEITQLQSTYSTVCDERNEWKSKYNELHHSNNVLKAQNEKAYSELAGLGSKYKTTCDERDGFKKQYNDVCVKIQQLEEQVVCLQKENLSLKSTYHPANAEPASCSSETSCDTNIKKTVKLHFNKFFSRRSARKIIGTLQNSGWEVIDHKSDYFGNVLVTVAIEKQKSLNKVFRQVKKSLRLGGINVKLQGVSADTISITSAASIY